MEFTLYYDKRERFLDQITKNFTLNQNEFFTSFLLKQNSDAISILNLKELDPKLLPTKYKFTSKDVQEVHSVYLGENILKSSLSKLKIKSLVDEYYIKKCFPSDTVNARKLLLDSITNKAWQYYDLYSSEYSFARLFQDVIVFLNELKSEIKESLKGIFDRILQFIRDFKITEPNRWRVKIRDKNRNWIPNPKYNPLIAVKGNDFSSIMDYWFKEIDEMVLDIIGKPTGKLNDKEKSGLIKTAQFLYNLVKEFFKPIYKVIKPIIATKLEFDVQCANAFLIGAINALVEFIAGFVEIIKLIVSLFEPESFKKMVDGFKKMITEIQKEGFFNYVGEVFSNLWKAYTAKYKDDGDVFEDIKDFTEDFGEIIVTLVLAIFSGGTSLVTTLKKVFKEILDCIKNPNKLIDEAISLLKKAVQQARTIIKNGGKVIAENSKKAVQKVRMGYKMIERKVFPYSLSKGNVLRCTILPFEEFTQLFAKGLTIAIRRKLLKFGIEIAENEGRYFMKYQGHLFELGDKKAVTTKLKEIFNKNEDDVKKWLDTALERRKIFLKWAEKFEKKFHLHFDGEIVVGKWSKRDGTPTLWSQGAHNHTVNGTKINIKEIRKPIVSRIEDIPNNVPFKANVEIVYSNRNIPKQNTSSFFPKNWDINRIKEEISIVYDEMIQSGFELKYSNNKYFTTNRKVFNIQIEVDDLGNLTNAYPLI